VLLLHGVDWGQTLLSGPVPACSGLMQLQQKDLPQLATGSSAGTQLVKRSCQFLLVQLLLCCAAEIYWNSHMTLQGAVSAYPFW
jgi:hypothetical protein